MYQLNLYNHLPPVNNRFQHLIPPPIPRPLNVRSTNRFRSPPNKPSKRILRPTADLPHLLVAIHNMDNPLRRRPEYRNSHCNPFPCRVCWGVPFYLLPA